MVNSIKIENLRSLKDTEFVQLKKLNILLGTNSSGKSTFYVASPFFFNQLIRIYVVPYLGLMIRLLTLEIIKLPKINIQRITRILDFHTN